MRLEKIRSAKRRNPAATLAVDVDRKSGIGLTGQLVAALKSEISSGKFRPGEALPGMDAIAGRAQVSEKTARHALAQLAAEGWVRPCRGVGSIVLEHGVNTAGKRVLLFQTCGTWSFYQGQFVSTLQWCVQREGFGFALVSAPGFRPNCDYSQLAVALKERWDLIVEMGGYVPSRQMIEMSGMPFAVVRNTPGKQRSKAPNCIGMIDLYNGKAIPDFAMECVKKRVRRVLQFLYGTGGFNAANMLNVSDITVETVSIPHQRSLDAIVRESMQTMSKRIESGEGLPDVILFNDDFIAQGGLLSLSAHGVRIPDDVAVVSHANKGLGPVWIKPVTCMEMDPVAHASEVAGAIVRYLKDGTTPIDCELGSIWKKGDTF